MKIILWRKVLPEVLKPVLKRSCLFLQMVEMFGDEMLTGSDVIRDESRLITSEMPPTQFDASATTLQHDAYFDNAIDAI